MSFTPIELKSDVSPDTGVKLNKGKSGNWYMVNTESKVACMWIQDVIVSIANYTGSLSMMKALTEDYTLHVYIHSPGGSIPAAAHIISAMSRCKAKIITHNLGLAASCGSLILACGDLIKVHPFAVTMFHASGSSASGLSHRLKISTEHLMKYVDSLFDMMKGRGMVTEQECEAIVNRGAEFYLTDDEMNRRLDASNIRYRGER